MIKPDQLEAIFRKYAGEGTVAESEYSGGLLEETSTSVAPEVNTSTVSSYQNTSVTKTEVRSPYPAMDPVGFEAFCFFGWSLAALMMMVAVYMACLWVRARLRLRQRMLMGSSVEEGTSSSSLFSPAPARGPEERPVQSPTAGLVRTRESPMATSAPEDTISNDDPDRIEVAAEVHRSAREERAASQVTLQPARQAALVHFE